MSIVRYCNYVNLWNTSDWKWPCERYLLLGMTFHVDIEESPTDKVLVTQFTLIRSLSGMVSPMYHKS